MTSFGNFVPVPHPFSARHYASYPFAVIGLLLLFSSPAQLRFAYSYSFSTTFIFFHHSLFFSFLFFSFLFFSFLFSSLSVFVPHYLFLLFFLTSGERRPRDKKNPIFKRPETIANELLTKKKNSSKSNTRRSFYK